MSSEDEEGGVPLAENVEYDYMITGLVLYRSEAKEWALHFPGVDLLNGWDLVLYSVVDGL